MSTTIEKKIIASSKADCKYPLDNVKEFPKKRYFSSFAATWMMNKVQRQLQQIL